jgi:subfamily B ATP-binding cassette protein MsbA
MLRLWPYIRPDSGLLKLSLLLAIPFAALQSAIAPISQDFIKRLSDGDRTVVWQIPLLLIGLNVANFIVRYAHYYSLKIVIARVNQRVKDTLFRHILGLSADYFTQEKTGVLAARVTADTQYVDMGIQNLNSAIREPLKFLLLFGYALYLNWTLTLLVFLVFPFLAWVFSATGRNLKRYMARTTEENAQLMGVLQEGLSGIRIVKLFRLENWIHARFQERSRSFSNFIIKTARVEEASHPMVELLTAIALAIVIYYGGWLVFNQEMSTDELIAFFITFGMMIHPIRNLNDINIKFNQTAAACDRIFEVLGWRSKLVETENPRPISTLQSKIEVQNVSFYYPDHPERPVLKSVSFEIPRGKTVALVGKSGSGKSSLSTLLSRIYDPKEGAILWDGVDLRELGIGNLREQVSVVSQDVFLFNDTIEENIRCGKQDATHEQVVEAARAAHALDFIEKIPEGFQSKIGERGQKLSGGERQRLSIARAFLRNSPLLVLDEATSNLDTTSEWIVQGALERLMEKKTTLLIAHRLSTIQNADLILVMRNGEIVERGTHSELLALKGEYAGFHRLQDLENRK